MWRIKNTLYSIIVFIRQFMEKGQCSTLVARYRNFYKILAAHRIKIAILYRYIILRYHIISYYINDNVMKMLIWKNITKNQRFRSVFQQIEYLQMNLDDSCGRSALLGGCSATRSPATISDAYYIFNSLVGIATKLHSDNAGAHRESSIFYSPPNPFAASLSCLAI